MNAQDERNASLLEAIAGAAKVAASDVRNNKLWEWGLSRTISQLYRWLDQVSERR